MKRQHVTGIALLLSLVITPARAEQHSAPDLPAGTARLGAAAATASYEGLLEEGAKSQNDGSLRDAITSYTAAITRDPRRAEAYKRRANVQAAAGHDVDALADASLALRLEPGWLEGRMLRSRVLQGMGRTDEAVADAEQLGALRDNILAQQLAGLRLATLERYDLADIHFRRALAIRPDPRILVTRAQFYRPDAVDVRLHDLDIVLRAEPDRVDALALKGDIQRLSGDAPGAVASYSRGLRRESEDVDLLAGREVAYRLLGDASRADRDADALTRVRDQGFAQFRACNAKAESNVDLERALRQCDASLRVMPRAAGVLRARGLALLRLRRFREAAAAYDQTLDVIPTWAYALYGRALARAALGDRAGSQGDVARALQIEPQTGKRFHLLGLSV